MATVVQCPNPSCGKKLRVPAALAGRHVRCSCGTRVAAPAGASVAGTSVMSQAAPLTAVVDLPAQFGRYEILQKLGQGGMGAVYLAHDTQLDRAVALKVPRFAPADGPQVLERFQREARAAATLDHPNICPVYDVGQHDGTHFMTMAFVEGHSLADHLARHAPLPPGEAAALVRTLALALAEAHRRGVIHRDLKPANVMINRRGEPVIMDFGLAHRAQSTDPRLSQAGGLLGTPAYMSPEQVNGDVEAVGPGCDVYSLGVILYELLTGLRPFEGPVLAVLGQVLTQPPEPPSRHRPGLDPALEAVCLRAMAKSPGDRYATMAELAADLTAFLQRKSPGGPPHPDPDTEAAPAPSPSAPPQRAVRRSRLAVGALAAAGLILGLVLVLRPGAASRTGGEAAAPDGAAPGQKGVEPPDPVVEPVAAKPPSRYALRFDGRRSRVVIPKSNFKYYGEHSLTIEALVTPYASMGRHEVMCDLTPGSGFSLALTAGHRWSFAFQFSKDAAVATNDTPVALRQRVHLAAVYDRDRRDLRMFVDGQLKNAVAPLKGKMRFASSPWDTIIGADPQNPGNRFGHLFAGLLEELRVSRVARYARDYEPPPVLGTDDDTRVLYLCREGKGNILIDESGRGNHARLEFVDWVELKP